MALFVTFSLCGPGTLAVKRTPNGGGPGPKGVEMAETKRARSIKVVAASVAMGGCRGEELRRVPQGPQHPKDQAREEGAVACLQSGKGAPPPAYLLAQRDSDHHADDLQESSCI